MHLFPITVYLEWILHIFSRCLVDQVMLGALPRQTPTMSGVEIIGSCHVRFVC